MSSTSGRSNINNGDPAPQDTANDNSVTYLFRRLIGSQSDTAQPRYLQITRGIEAMIGDGTLAIGATLPSERRLAELVGVSRITIQKAYNTLRQNRMLSAHGRHGHIVQANGGRLTAPMNKLRGFTEEMLELGRVPESKIVEQTILHDRQIATIFGLTSGAPLLRLKRIRYADGLPMSSECAWYNLHDAPFLANTDLSGSVYALLSQHGSTLTHCEQTIEAVISSAEERRIFDFQNDVACVLIKRRSYTADNVLLEYVEGTFRGDIYSYRMSLHT